MAIYPGAQYRPLGTQTQSRMKAVDVCVLHTMVGTLAGTDAMFKRNGFTGTESHFGVGADGTVYQWQDTDYTADANLDGNSYCLSIETEDFGGVFGKWDTSGDNVPVWTPQQIEALAGILAWASKTHNIPLCLVPNTLRGTRGVGYHAQGVPGNGLVNGGVCWSSAKGKVCPGKKRIAQVPEVIARAAAITGGGVISPARVVPPAPSPAFPLPAGYYFGPKDGPKESVSGYYSHRDDLRTWQTQMAARGWNITADGYYGNETAKITKQFQAQKNLAVDGKIGPATWTAAWTAPVS